MENFHCFTCFIGHYNYSRTEGGITLELAKIAEKYGEKLKDGDENVTVEFPEYTPLARVEQSCRGAGIFGLIIPELIGVHMLVMNGEDRLDQRYAKRFMKIMARNVNNWQLPIPPLELTPRPLFYIVGFRFRGCKKSPQKWESIASLTLARAIGLGIAFVQLAERLKFRK